MKKRGYTVLAGGLLSAGLLLPSTSAGAAPPEGEGGPAASDAPVVQRPKAAGDEQNAPEDAPNEKAAPAPGAETSEEAAATQPSEPTTQPTPGTEPTPAATPSEPKAGEMGGLLAPSQGSDPVGPRTTAPPREEAGIGKEEKLTRYYASLYRPADNPGRFNFGARALFMAVGANHNEIGGRMGGVTMEAGQTWNWIGYALTGTAYFGQTILGVNQEHELNTMVGGGPTLGLGRLSLIRYGYMDFRVGYDFFYAPQKISALGVVDGVTEQPGPIAPHGPRFRIDMGLLLHRSGGRRFRHGVGATFGYQRLVGSLVGEMRGANVLMLGFNYFLG